MALGNNLKKKLIPDKKDEGKEKKAKKSKKPVKKKTESATVPKPEKDKKLIQRKETNVSSNKAQQKAPEAQKTSETHPTQTHSYLNPQLPVYIARELLDRKERLRLKYNTELSQIKNQPVQFVLLTIGGESYAVDIDAVKEVVPLSVITKAPNAPKHIKGIANVRGNTYVVYDLAKRFSVLGDEVPRYLLVLKDEEIATSLTLSTLPTTLKTHGNKISSSIKLLEDALLDASYIKGLIQNGDNLVYYLDIIELLKNDKAIVVPDEIAQLTDE